MRRSRAVAMGVTVVVMAVAVMPVGRWEWE